MDLLHEMQQGGVSSPLIIGGGLIDDQICRYGGADHQVADVMNGVYLCKKLMAS